MITLPKLVLNLDQKEKIFLMVLLFAYIPFVTLINLSPLGNSPFAISIILSEIILIVIFFLSFQNELDEYNIDKLSILLFIIAGIFRKKLLASIIGVVFEILSIQFIILYTLLVIKNYSKYKKYSFFNFWNAIGLFVGLLGVIFTTMMYPVYYNYNLITNTPLFELIIIFLPLILNALLGNVVFEEIIFRGMMLGILKKTELPVLVIIIFQSIVFVIPHLFFISQPKTLLALLVNGIIYGTLAVKSKSITPAIIAHVFHNAFLSFISVI